MGSARGSGSEARARVEGRGERGRRGGGDVSEGPHGRRGERRTGGGAAPQHRRDAHEGHPQTGRGRGREGVHVHEPSALCERLRAVTSGGGRAGASRSWRRSHRRRWPRACTPGRQRRACSRGRRSVPCVGAQRYAHGETHAPFAACSTTRRPPRSNGGFNWRRGEASTCRARSRGSIFEAPLNQIILGISYNRQW